MPTNQRSIYCCEVDKVVQKKYEDDIAVSCITDYEGFHGVCLNVWVLQTAYFNYRQRYGVAEEKAIHK